MKVLIAVPALDTCATDFAMSLAALMGHTTRDSLRREVKVSLFCQKGSVVMEARNAIVREAQRIEADSILFLDSDMTFPPDTLQRLLAHKRDIVGAQYVKRVEPYNLLGEPAGNALHTHTINRMASLPFGCILIRTSVFTVVPAPWFRYLTTELGTMSEDTYFCHAAIAEGFDIWCDPSLTRELGHVGSAIFRSPK